MPTLQDFSQTYLKQYFYWNANYRSEIKVETENKPNSTCLKDQVIHGVVGYTSPSNQEV